jgi:hypothetical protein
VVSGHEDEGKKVALVKINIENSGSKVTTVLKGGGGGTSLFMLFLLSLSMLLKRILLRTIRASK